MAINRAQEITAAVRNSANQKTVKNSMGSDAEVLEAVCSVLDSPCTKTADEWRAHDMRKERSAEKRRFEERGLRTKKKLSHEERRAFARMARPPPQSKALKRAFGSKAPKNKVKETTVPRTPQVRPQPEIRVGDIDAWIQGQELIGDFGTGETRGNAQMNSVPVSREATRTPLDKETKLLIQQTFVRGAQKEQQEKKAIANTVAGIASECDAFVLESMNTPVLPRERTYRIEGGQVVPSAAASTSSSPTEADKGKEKEKESPPEPESSSQSVKESRGPSHVRANITIPPTPPQNTQAYAAVANLATDIALRLRNDDKKKGKADEDDAASVNDHPLDGRHLTTSEIENFVHHRYSGRAEIMNMAQGTTLMRTGDRRLALHRGVAYIDQPVCINELTLRQGEGQFEPFMLWILFASPAVACTLLTAIASLKFLIPLFLIPLFGLVAYFLTPEARYKTSYFRWAPHMVACIYAELKGSHCNDVTLESQANLIAKRLAGLPLIDSIYSSVSDGSVALAVWLIRTRQEDFTMRQDIWGHFTPVADLT